MKDKIVDPTIEKAKNGKKRKKPILSKKNRKKKRKEQEAITGISNKSDSSNGSLKANAFYIVPWRRSADWDNVCTLYNDGKYEDVIKELTIWRERVASLPVGAESTIFLLQAIIADRQNKSDDEARSLYSLAVVRFLNHISHVATKEMGENAPVPLMELVSHLSVPEWIVQLRHEISHGTTLPSLEILHEAADFIKTWLTDNYWVDSRAVNTNNQPDIDILTNRSENVEPKEEKYSRMCQFISAFIASKIYHLRATKAITDPEITHSIKDQPWSVKPKVAAGFFKTKVANFFTKDPQLLCTAIANEMIPPENFVGDFCALFNLPVGDEKIVFDKYYEVWAPLIDLIQTRGRLRQVCTLLAEEHIRDDSTRTVKLFTALWLNILFEKLGHEEKTFPFRLKSILLKVISNPNEFTNRFFSRLLALLEKHLGVDKTRQLETLFNIWMDEANNTDKIRRAFVEAEDQLFTVDDLPFNSKSLHNLQQTQSYPNIPFAKPPKQQANWSIDYRDSHFWRKIPLGGEI